MARAYQEAHIVDTLKDSVKSLQAQTTELIAAKNRHEERIKNLSNAKEALEQRNAVLELRVKAKSAARLPPLSPLHNAVLTLSCLSAANTTPQPASRIPISHNPLIPTMPSSLRSTIFGRTDRSDNFRSMKET